MLIKNDESIDSLFLSAVQSPVLFIFTRDLRLADNRALYEALLRAEELTTFVLPVFFIEETGLPHGGSSVQKNILNGFLGHLLDTLHEHNSHLFFLRGIAGEALQRLYRQINFCEVFISAAQGADEKERESRIAATLNTLGVPLHVISNHLILPDNIHVRTREGKPYQKFTPYMKEFLRVWNDEIVQLHYPSEKKLQYLAEKDTYSCKDCADTEKIAGSVAKDFYDRYLPTWKETELRMKAHSQLSNELIPGGTQLAAAIRWGALSVRMLARIALREGENFLRALIWREFFYSLVEAFPQTRSRSFQEKYEKIPWREAGEYFEKWKAGETGFPLIDAAMIHLKKNGIMPNRLRMLTASFLSRYVFVYWKLGEEYFAENLIDYDEALNVGNWQWAAGSGADAVPYFRFFNPELQMKKFDPQFTYIHSQIPDFNPLTYREPMFDWRTERARAREIYAVFLSSQK